MADFCERCGCNLPDGAVQCPQCGARLIPGDAPVGAPPRTRPARHVNPQGLFILVLLVVVVAAAAFTFTGGMGNGTDGPNDPIKPGMDTTDKDANILWNYTSTTTDDPDDSRYSIILVEIGIKNVNIENLNTSDPTFRLKTSDGKEIHSTSQTCDKTGILAKGAVAHYRATFKVADSDTKNISLSSYSSVGGRVYGYDGSISVR